MGFSLRFIAWGVIPMLRVLEMVSARGKPMVGGLEQGI
jgi:hypothetical protein